MKCELTHLFHLFASKKTRGMEIYGVISEAGAQMFPLSKKCMINLGYLHVHLFSTFKTDLKIVVGH